MSKLPIRSVWIDPYIRAALREYAYVRRTTMSSVARAVVQSIIDDATDKEFLPADMGKVTTTHLNFKIEDEVWLAAVDAAHAVGSSMNSLFRRRLRQMLIKEGLL